MLLGPVLAQVVLLASTLLLVVPQLLKQQLSDVHQEWSSVKEEFRQSSSTLQARCNASASGDVSCKVRDMYMQSPFPRW